MSTLRIVHSDKDSKPFQTKGEIASNERRWWRGNQPVDRNEIKRGKATRLKGNAGHGPNRTTWTTALAKTFIFPGKSLLTDQSHSTDILPSLSLFLPFPPSDRFRAAWLFPHVHIDIVSLCSNFLRSHCHFDSFIVRKLLSFFSF